MSNYFKHWHDAIKICSKNAVCHTSLLQNYLTCKHLTLNTTTVTLPCGLGSHICKKWIFGESEDLGLAEETLRKQEFIYSFNQYF